MKIAPQQIDTDVQPAAIVHLKAKDAETTLSHFNGEVLAADINGYLKIFKEVNYATPGRWPCTRNK